MAALRRKLPNPPKLRGNYLTSSTSEEAVQVVLFGYDEIPNDQTRLLKIYPGERNEDITVSISTVSIDELGPPSHEYEALSYHWGEGLHNDPIYVQNSNDSGRGQAKAIYVTPNLYAALQHLRKGDFHVLMWVDAICINQNDEREKTAQVARMWEIYRRATRVCIWLGWGEESSCDAMRFIAEIVSSDTNDIFKAEEHIFRWQNLARLLRSEWFSRRWIIQEVALSREATVHYGQEEIHWDDFRDGISLFATHFDTIRGLFEKSDEFRSVSNPIEELDTLSAKVLVDFTSNFRNDGIFEPTLGLEYLVSTLSAFKCSDSRDTVFALQNIARETPRLVPAKGHHPPPEPDYTKDLFEVYRDFVRWVCQTSNSLDLICRHWALPERERALRDTLPSWILMIGKGPSRRNGASFVGLPGRPIYNASYRRDPLVMFEADRQQTPIEPHDGAPAEPNDDAPIEPHDAPAEPHDVPAELPDAPAEPNDDAPIEPHDAPLEPHDAPLEPHDAPVEPHDAPVEPHDVPAELHDAPAEPNDDAPIEPHDDAPAEPYDVPAELNDDTPVRLNDDALAELHDNAPAESHDAPADPHDAPVEPHDVPAELHDAPADPHDAPAEPHDDAPVEPHDNSPAESHDAPADPHDAPVEPHDVPAELHDAPAEPNDDAPIEPHDDAPAEPHDDAPAEPHDDAPAEPHDDAPAEPHDDAPTEPHDDALAEPYDVPAELNDDTPARPNDDAPAEPHDDVPAEPHDDAPAEPHDDAPVEPHDDAPTEPHDAPAEPNDDTPARPNDDAPAESHDDAPAELNDAPAEPNDAPAEPNDAPAEPNDAPAEPNDDTPARPNDDAPAELSNAPVERNNDRPAWSELTSGRYSLPGAWPNDDPKVDSWSNDALPVSIQISSDYTNNAQPVKAQSPVLPPTQPIGSRDCVTTISTDPAPHQNLDLSLYVKGLEIGKIIWTSEPIIDGVIPQSCLERAGWTQSGGSRAPDKLWRTLVADRGPDGNLPPSWYHRACLDCLVNSTKDGNINTNELLKEAPTKIVKGYLTRVQTVIWDRKFLEAEKGLFGLCSYKAQPNDIVCILFGCSAPVVLRKVDERDGDGYLFVEEAYIYGKMEGEAIIALTSEELAKRTKEFRLI